MPELRARGLRQRMPAHNANSRGAGLRVSCTGPCLRGTPLHRQSRLGCSRQRFPTDGKSGSFPMKLVLYDKLLSCHSRKGCHLQMCSVFPYGLGGPSPPHPVGSALRPDLHGPSCRSYSRVGCGKDKHGAVGGHGLGAVFPRVFLLLLLLFLLFWQWVWVGVFVHCWDKIQHRAPATVSHQPLGSCSLPRVGSKLLTLILCARHIMSFDPHITL